MSSISLIICARTKSSIGQFRIKCIKVSSSSEHNIQVPLTSALLDVGL